MGQKLFNRIGLGFRHTEFGMVPHGESESAALHDEGYHRLPMAEMDSPFRQAASSTPLSSQKLSDLLSHSAQYGWLLWGQKAMLAGRYDSAIECFRMLTEREPWLGAAHVILGHTFYQMGETQWAVNAYLKALDCELSPMLAMELCERVGLAYQDVGDLDSAYQYFRQGALTPIADESAAIDGHRMGDNPRWWKSRLMARWGAALGQKEQMDEAKDRIQDALVLDADSSLAYQILARLYQIEGNLEESQRCLDRALFLGQDEGLIWFEMGRYRLESGRLTEGIDYMERALAGEGLTLQHLEAIGQLCLDAHAPRLAMDALTRWHAVAARELGRPTPVTLHQWRNMALLLGDAAHALGNLEEAESQWNQAMALDDTHHATWKRLAQLAQQRGEYGLAYERYHHALNQMPNYGPYLIALGDMASLQHQFDGAFEWFVQAKDLNPESAPLHWAMAETFERMGQPEQALNYYERALQYNPEQPLVEQLHRAMARVWMELGKFEQAYDHANRLSEWSTFHGEGARLKAEALLGMGEADEALTLLIQWRELEPDRPEPYCYLAKVYGALGDTAQQAAALEQADYFAQQGPRAIENPS